MPIWQYRYADEFEVRNQAERVAVTRARDRAEAPRLSIAYRQIPKRLEIGFARVDARAARRLHCDRASP
jgi:hypothetical protein